MFIDKVVCVGKNYLEHAKELGESIPQKPVLFLKPASVLQQVSGWGEQIEARFPDEESDVQPECEIVLRIAFDGFKMSEEEAKNAISDVTLGLDVTLRTRQSELKKQGHPWTTAKVFRDAAIIGPWIPRNQFEHYLETEFQMKINGTVCQCAKGSDMIMHPEKLIVYISHFFPLKTGDVIFTGTPAGMTSIFRRDKAELCWCHHSFSVQWE
ncbi:2-keto-4-pentenoate hydratase/2-oxohepta-3-ene-1,7-dioic acid hydratase (catechol pathway) [Legionella wadsworthii]|uniref:2-keto-4-pentenoate hydratase/2-oxohepta-3-ene-1,7-dioic acid hydratase (Catechol pathway) n=1 Tax=Legionella wadsworthii TaxID=28088 RepID=A0A378LRV0_9GAMM|nr:fumarylacetoacetate hydrolase family protein [Legionella wadsworthii]STY29100.1 2-keto-4-pentenoate hydratase/2-oxohepta-3-ene-1,7-dioic acid hydratase (catechol pathway) [Legionella wadsworthii]